jgi:23S rRNA G2069 N7-methylase RlmK/C1962 C5-methylase RlmI
LEGLPEVTGWLRGEGPTDLVLTEHEWKLALSISEGHKTGFYLDQRDSRKRFADATRRLGFQRVLNCYCYTGGFTVAALSGGAGHVTSIDSSGPAIAKAAANVALNGFDASRTTFMDADVNASLRAFAAEGRTFDAIILDPPKFAPTVAHTLSGQPEPTRISTAWLSSCWSPVGCCLHTVALAASVRICSTRLWRVRVPMRVWMALSPTAWVVLRTTP